MTPNRRLKQARELRGWSQAKVAEQIGTDATTVSRWERGLFSPTPYFRERLCTLFNKNAAELGLLDIEYEPEEIEPRVLTPRPPVPLAFQQESDGLHAVGPQTSTIAPPAAPSWPRRGDTFGYILDSAAHDQQAHMLWEDAYVRAIRGQRAEAQLLGEASLNAFEHVGHPNAEALREWLKKNELLPPSEPPSSHSSAPMALIPKPPRRTVKQIFRRRNLGLALLLTLLAAIGLVGFSLNHALAPSVQAGIQTVPIARTQVPVQRVATTPATTGVTATATTPVSTPTSRPTNPTATPTYDTSGLVLMISPASLTPGQCMPDSGYRCTLFLTLNYSQQVTLSWQGSSTNLAVKFSPGSGHGRAGDQIQVIVYIQSVPGQRGQLVFTLKSSTSSIKVVVPWQG